MNTSFVKNFRVSVRGENWRKTVLAAALLSGLATTSPALATSTGIQMLGTAKNAIDVWTFTCPGSMGRPQANVSDIAPDSPLTYMQVVLGKAGFGSSQATDVLPIPSGEGGAASPTVLVVGGSGLYTVAFKKTGVGVEFYTGKVVCCNLNGDCINPTLSRSIDQ